MNELTVHFTAHNHPIDPEFLARLGTVAEEYGVSIDPQTRQAIEEAARKRKRSVKEFIRKADWKHRLEDFREQVGPIQSDSALDIRELRDSR
ncbi:MAG: hypothetical protein AB1656_23360 [Candidatus Omnitrophota bacterium]